MRNSKQRNLVQDILKNCCDHPTADVVYERAREKSPNISLGTVYRNLNMLAENNDILTLETKDKCLHYDGNNKNHLHFICCKCGKIVDLFVEPSYPIEFEQMGLNVTEAKCVYYGLCDKCVNEKKIKD